MMIQVPILIIAESTNCKMKRKMKRYINNYKSKYLIYFNISLWNFFYEIKEAVMNSLDLTD